MSGDPTYDIAERADHVEVRGVTSRDIIEALELYARMRAAQAEHVAKVRDDLVHTLMARNVPEGGSRISHLRPTDRHSRSSVAVRTGWASESQRRLDATVASRSHIGCAAVSKSEPSIPTYALATDEDPGSV
ncbi:MAG TPA: hypothetical protein VIW24_08625 [Aldersonia sp.]